ncbi:hypothetical protein [Salinicoccus sp. CNSTN-B1]
MMKRYFVAALIFSMAILAACSDGTQDATGEEASAEEPRVAVTDEQREALERKFDGMAEDPYIDAIEPQDEDYTLIHIVVSEKFDELEESDAKGKLQGFGEAVREGADGILFDSSGKNLPMVKFMTKDDELIGEYDNRNRGADIHFESFDF